MDKAIAEAIGILRHQIISPVLMESGRSQMKYFRSLLDREFDVPGKGKKTFKATTMKGWLQQYRKHGFKGITPNQRTDIDTHRKISPEMKERLIDHRKTFSGVSAALFYKKCIEAKLLGEPPICLATVRRFLKMNKLHRPTDIDVRKRYEMSSFGELFVGDYMHGPQVLVGKSKKKAILFAIIDDHSRMIVGHAFGIHENTITIENVFKETILKFGLCDKIYLDNGPSFSSQYLARVCAHLNIALVHSKPYDSPSRGKIERFFRTVREMFLVGIRPAEELTLDHLNEKFSIWLRDEYHLNHHSGINCRPIDRYNISIMRYPRKMVDPSFLEEYFMVVQKRSVKKDATISYLGKIYEVPGRFIGQEIEIRHNQGAEFELYLYENDQRIARLAFVDKIENGRIFRPKKIEQISFSTTEDDQKIENKNKEEL